MQHIAESNNGFQFYFTDVSDGDSILLENVTRTLLELSFSGVVTNVTQVHGNRVAILSPLSELEINWGQPLSFVNLGNADAIISSTRQRVALLVRTADCVPVGLFDEISGINAVIHAGWRGLKEGVIESTVKEMRNLGAKTIRAVIGPHAGRCCYAFSPNDIQNIGEHFGVDCSFELSTGEMALDLYILLSKVLSDISVAFLDERPDCTICNHRYYSFRRDGTKKRMALIGLYREP